MKKIIVLVLLTLSMLAAHSQEKKLSRKEKKAQQIEQQIQQTLQLVTTRNWQFNASQMLPSAGINRVLTSPYHVIVENELLKSYLPFYGRAYTAEYGTTGSPMTFEANMEDYTMEQNKKGGYTIKFSAKNKNDYLKFTFKISATGSAILGVNSTNRQHISYHGDLVPIQEKQK